MKNQKIKIAIGTDHRGYLHKKYIMTVLDTVAWIDVGSFNEEPSDYPLFAQKVCQHIFDKSVTVGVLLCGTGVGMAITANRYKHIYAGVAWSTEIAKFCKEDDNVNVLVLPADYISLDASVAIIKSWQEAVFQEGHYARRIALIDC